MVGLGGNVQVVPLGVVLSEEPACKVVGVPTSKDDDHRRTGSETGQGDVSPPVPGLLTDGRGVGLLTTLDRVIDEQEVDCTARHCTADTDREHAAHMAAELPLGLGGHVVPDLESETGVLCDVVTHGATPACGDARLIGGHRDAEVGVLVECPEREAA